MIVFQHLFACTPKIPNAHEDSEHFVLGSVKKKKKNPNENTPPKNSSKNNRPPAPLVLGPLTS